MSDPDRFAENVVYRLCYGVAAALVERRRQSSVASVWRTPEAVEDILATVVRRVGCDPDDPNAREAVEDVLAGRRPRW